MGFLAAEVRQIGGDEAGVERAKPEPTQAKSPEPAGAVPLKATAELHTPRIEQPKKTDVANAAAEIEERNCWYQENE